MIPFGHVVISSLLIALAIPAATAQAANWGLTPAAEDSMRSMADSHPALLQLFLADAKQKDSALTLDAVSSRVVAAALLSIKKIVRPEILPEDLKKTMVPLKDVKQWERKDQKGVLISNDLGDYLTVESASQGNHIFIAESGYTISVRIDLGTPIPIDANPTGSMRALLTSVLRLPDDAMNNITVSSDRAPIYKAAYSGERNPTLAHWWDRLEAYSDGRFLFVLVGEEEGANKMHPKAGLPDRF